MQPTLIQNPLPPLYDENSRVLLLGSLPSPMSRQTGFYYGHPQNRFWRVIAAVLDAPLPQTIAEKRALCLANGIALWDVIACCEIAGASDASIKNATPNDLAPLLQNSRISRIFATGKKAEALYLRLIYPKTGLPITALPSTSPANAAFSFADLVARYRVLLSCDF